MDKESKNRIIKRDAVSYEGKINEKYTYVKNDNNFEVDDGEFQMIMEFVAFVRSRVRGTFIADIVTHKEQRYVMLNFTDKKKIDLEAID